MRTLLSLLLALSFVIVSVSGVLAQDSEDVFCGDLSAEDCALLQDSAMVMQELSSGAYDSTVAFLLTGIPEAPFDEIAVTLNQSASYVTDPAFKEMMASLSDEEKMAMAMDTESSMGLLMDVLDNTDMAHETTIQLSPDTAALLSANMDGIPVPEDIYLRFVVVDGVGYVNLDDIAVLAPEMGQMSGWVGTDLRPLLELAAAQIAAQGQSPDETAALGMAVALASPQAQQELLNDYLSISRESDDPAEFVTEFDMGAFATSPEFIDLVLALVEQSEDVPVSAEELAQAQMMLPMMAPLLFGGLDIYSVQIVDPETAYTTEYDTVFEWDLSGIMGMAAMSGAFPAPAAGETTFVGFNTTTEYSMHDAIAEITVPEGAMYIPGDMLIEMAQ